MNHIRVILLHFQFPSVELEYIDKLFKDNVFSILLNVKKHLWVKADEIFDNVYRRQLAASECPHCINIGSQWIFALFSSKHTRTCEHTRRRMCVGVCIHYNLFQFCCGHVRKSFKFNQNSSRDAIRCEFIRTWTLMRLKDCNSHSNSGNSSSAVSEHLLGFSWDLDCTCGRPEQKIILSLSITSALHSARLMCIAAHNGLSEITFLQQTRAEDEFDTVTPVGCIRRDHRQLSVEATHFYRNAQSDKTAVSFCTVFKNVFPRVLHRLMWNVSDIHFIKPVLSALMWLVEQLHIYQCNYCCEKIYN